MHLQEVYELLEIPENHKLKFHKGLKYSDKNKYAEYKDIIIIRLNNRMYFITDNTQEVKDILKINCFYTLQGGAYTNKHGAFNKLYMWYNSRYHQCTHLNKNLSDYRAHNLKIVPRYYQYHSKDRKSKLEEWTKEQKKEWKNIRMILKDKFLKSKGISNINKIYHKEWLKILVKNRKQYKKDNYIF